MIREASKAIDVISTSGSLLARKTKKNIVSRTFSQLDSKFFSAYCDNWTESYNETLNNDQVITRFFHIVPLDYSVVRIRRKHKVTCENTSLLFYFRCIWGIIVTLHAYRDVINWDNRLSPDVYIYLYHLCKHQSRIVSRTKRPTFFILSLFIHLFILCKTVEV